MRVIRQLLRQPIKSICGVIGISLAVAILCICFGQFHAANNTEKKLQYSFTTVALPTLKYNYYESYYIDLEGNRVPFTAWSQTLPVEIADWITNIVQMRSDIVETLASPGLASAYIPELSIDNITKHRYHNPMRGNATEPHKLEEQPNYSSAMLEIVLDEIGSPNRTVISGVMPDGSETSVLTEVTVVLKGTVKRVISLESGYDDPTGRTVFVTLVLPDDENLAALELTCGQRYLVYGTDYTDEDWKLCGDVSYSLGMQLGYDIDLETLDPNAFVPYDENAKAFFKENNPYAPEPYGNYYYSGESGTIFTTIFEYQYEKVGAISLTAKDLSQFGMYEWIEHSDGSGYPCIKWERWIADENGDLVKITQEEYHQRYAVPVIAHLNGSAEEFLQSTDGALWGEQMALMEINYHAFPVIGVHKLGSIADFAREMARIVEGRDFTQKELDSGAKVCIIAESLAAANGLKVGDAIPLEFYNYDWDSPYQSFISDGEGVVNPSAYTYTANTEFVGEEEAYIIVGLYRQDYAWCDVCENVYSFTPNTVFVPHNAVPSDMDYSDQAFFRTIILKNGAVETFRTLIDEAGYDGLFVYYDQGYTTIAESLHNYKSVGERALWVGLIVYCVILVVFLLLLTGSQKKVLSTMKALGAPYACKFVQIFMSSTGILIPGTVIGTTLAVLLWQRVVDTLAESVGTTVAIQMDISSIIIVAMVQLLLALLLTTQIALRIIKAK